MILPAVAYIRRLRRRYESRLRDESKDRRRALLARVVRLCGELCEAIDEAEREG